MPKHIFARFELLRIPWDLITRSTLSLTTVWESYKRQVCFLSSAGPLLFYCTGKGEKTKLFLLDNTCLKGLFNLFLQPLLEKRPISCLAVPFISSQKYLNYSYEYAMLLLHITCAPGKADQLYQKGYTLPILISKALCEKPMPEIISAGLLLKEESV